VVLVGALVRGAAPHAGTSASNVPSAPAIASPQGLAAPSLAAQGAAAGVAAPQDAGAPSRELLDRYCVGCHNQRTEGPGRPAFDRLDLTQVGTHAAVLEKVVKKLRSGQMPPDGSRQPEPAQRAAFLTSLEAALDREGARAPNPGRVATRRLNRLEYVNTIQDLLGLTIDGTQLLPSDMSGFGFDNNADVLSITPALMTRYIAAATKVSRAAVGSLENRPVQQLYTLGSEQQDGRMNEDMPFATHGGLAVRHLFPLDGEYAFAVRLKGSDNSGIGGIEDPHEIELRLDRELVKRFTIGGQFKGPDPGALIPVEDDDIEGQKLHEYRLTADKALEIRLPVKAGVRLVSVAFRNAAPTPLDGAEYGRPAIDKMYVSGPFEGAVPADTPSRRRIFVCKPAGANDEAACARQILTTLARRAYRRPATAADVEPLFAIYQQARQDRDFDTGIERAIETLLSTPKFLLRVERQPAGVAAPYRLTDLELASRLSFFLWRSIPDDELIDLAARNELQKETVLDRQVRRMLADPRATRFLNDFVGQWLEVRNLYGQQPDPQVFPAFNDTLRKAMVRETELFFESQVREDKPILELLQAPYTYLNEPLARHYGIQNVYGTRFRRVALTDERRGGLLGHASVLTTTSYANRTSVVLRGKWVLSILLGAPPPDPPPNVPTLPANNPAKPTTLRERMQQHRAIPTCATCHTKMDPLGFALEQYDGIGRWRDNDEGAPIDATITLDGRLVDSPQSFREALLTRSDEVVHTVTEKLLTYALGRGVEYFDQPTVRELVRDVRKDGDRWSSLILGIVRSQPFRMRGA
jgi:mono/diheme cytochrome c family protein